MKSANGRQTVVRSSRACVGMNAPNGLAVSALDAPLAPIAFRAVTVKL
jgi:hypothetical protein